MVDKKLINNKNNNYCVDKKLIDISNNNNTNSYNSNDEIVDSNYESKYIDIIADHISSAILRLKSKELLQLTQIESLTQSLQLNKSTQFHQSNQPTQSNNSIIQFILNSAEMTGLNETLKLNQHTTEIKQVDYDDSYSEICNNDYNYDCYENCNDNNNHKNKSFHDFDNKEDL